MNTRPVKATDLGVARRRLRWARAFVSAAALRPAIVAAFLAASALAQQAPEVPVQGEVKDSTGAVLASASVRIFRGVELVAATQTNEQGQFSFRAAPGEYRIEIEAADFSPHEEKIFI